ncbi:MAG: hypothetical protein HKN76_20315 [Saprospiraceae bacterium]|nr:hypothetical protein [Saprospiraceae bacterium]
MKTVLCCICGLFFNTMLLAQWTVVNNDEIFSSDEDLRIVDGGPEILLESNAQFGAGIKSKWWASGNLVTLRSYDGDLSLSANDDINFYMDQNLHATLNQDGNFGIGVSNPLAKLHIDGSVRFDDAQSLDWYEEDGKKAYLYYNNSDLYLVNLDDTGGPTPGDIYVTALERMIITSGGGTSIVADEESRVGISGVFVPQYDLHVGGDIGFTGELTATSDIRLKEDIVELENVTQHIMSLRPVSYNFRTNEYPDLNLSPRRKMGLIAQEVEKVFPHLVSTTQSTGSENYKMKDVKSVNYMELIPVLIKSFQELHTQLAQQHEELEALRNKVSKFDKN